MRSRARATRSWPCAVENTISFSARSWPCIASARSMKPPAPSQPSGISARLVGDRARPRRCGPRTARRSAPPCRGSAGRRCRRRRRRARRPRRASTPRPRSREDLGGRLEDALAVALGVLAQRASDRRSSVRVTRASVPKVEDMISSSVLRCRQNGGDTSTSDCPPLPEPPLLHDPTARPTPRAPLADPRGPRHRPADGRARRDDREHRAARRAQEDLGFSDDDRQWIVTAYALAFGSLLLLGGRLGDLFGRKRMFIVGLVGFAVASALGGAAQSFGMLVAARAAAGRLRRAARARRAVAADHDVHRPARARQGVRHLRRDRRRAAPRSACCSAACSPSTSSWRWCLYVNLRSPCAAALGAFVAADQPGARATSRGSTCPAR